MSWPFKWVPIPNGVALVDSEFRVEMVQLDGKNLQPVWRVFRRNDRDADFTSLKGALEFVEIQEGHNRREQIEAQTPVQKELFGEMFPDNVKRALGESTDGD